MTVRPFVITTKHKHVLIKGHIVSDSEVFVSFRLDQGSVKQRYTSLQKVFNLSPTSYYIFCKDRMSKEKTIRRWTGGHKLPGALPPQKQQVPTDYEQIAALECGD